MTTDTATALDLAARGGERSDDADLHAWHALAPLATEYPRAWRWRASTGSRWSRSPPVSRACSGS